MIIFLLFTQHRGPGVCVKRASKSVAAHGRSHLTAHPSETPTPSPPFPRPVNQLLALRGYIILRCYCYYLPNQSLSSAGLVAAAFHQAYKSSDPCATTETSPSPPCLPHGPPTHTYTHSHKHIAVKWKVIPEWSFHSGDLIMCLFCCLSKHLRLSTFERF